MLEFILYLIFFVALGSLAKSVGDVISFAYDRSIFTSLPAKWQQYADPRVSWENKHTGFFLTDWILSTVLVWATDLWHLTESIFYIGVLGAGWSLYGLYTSQAWEFNELVLALSAIYIAKGAIFEFLYGKVFIRQTEVASTNAIIRRLAGAPSRGRNVFSHNLVSGLFKSVGIMLIIGLFFVGQLWLFRWIAGVPIHDYSSEILWPSTVVIVEFLLGIAVSFILWVRTL